MGRKHKSFSGKDGEAGEVKQLKEKVKRLASDKKRLIAEVTTLHAALDKTREFIDNKLDGVSIEKVIKSIKEEKKLKHIAAPKANEQHEVISNDDKCERCSRPLKIMFSNMTRTIFRCDTCKVNKVEYENEKTI